ncbi:MAG: 5-bromo-4-chloroindolyl phosphate hydrolysis family protein [Faecalibacterium prausnitzii]|uniref:5-bromo-4-chloroindolyl phosphate hydrolysis family protein n=1 Tax=Faecalibacterium prausnitzii TaxID=853 RepID=A0A9E1GIS1_9FIRM|nr:5-bromo-4-chloroindolyl phosphate hydrolysis family protein [Faecalibacterium prausnitzii]
MTDRENDFNRTAQDGKGRQVQQELERQLRELGDTMSDSFRHGFEGRGEEIGDRVWDVGRAAVNAAGYGISEAGRAFQAGKQKYQKRAEEARNAAPSGENAGGMADWARNFFAKKPEPTAIENIRTSAKKRHSAGVAMLATGITFAVIFGITAIACFGTAGAFTSGSVMAVDELVLGAAAETADTFLNAIGDLALGAIAATGWCSAAVTAVFGWLTAAGASRMKAAKTLELYADTAEGFDWHKGLSLSMLADLTHKKKTKALKMLRKFIHKGWLSAWLDEKNDKLYLTAEDYRAAQENQPQPEPEKAPEQAGEVPLNLETTRRFAQVLEKEQELMEDERAVEELQHMQKTTESICAWLEAHPESLPKARRFAEYYIPTTLKLLHTYNDVQSQQGENAEAIRRDIAGILHTLNQAYDNLYDKLLSDVALDVSSEIAALQGMLANDGLAGEGLR